MEFYLKIIWVYIWKSLSYPKIWIYLMYIQIWINIWISSLVWSSQLISGYLIYIQIWISQMAVAKPEQNNDCSSLFRSWRWVLSLAATTCISLTLEMFLGLFLKMRRVFKQWFHTLILGLMVHPFNILNNFDRRKFCFYISKWEQQ